MRAFSFKMPLLTLSIGLAIVVSGVSAQIGTTFLHGTVLDKYHAVVGALRCEF